MKLLKSIAVATTLVMFSLPSMASTSLLPGSKYSVQSNERVINTTTFETRDAAYAEGQHVLNVLETSKPEELHKMLRVMAWGPQEISSLRIQDNGYVTVDEMMSSDGNVEYRANVNVRYEHFRYDNN
ncbi:DUF3316 domain-containing protein [Photobacterium lutimaris]|jgi:sulfite reductase alpha subunit-like flavoprotein|uniref:Acyl-CoA synthetase n=1 Tax=Photobacterium lutimaris TaxID=388278 RepID=A0A2T3IZW1_9GAMM|nr:DUF3316 domain-containing protein [Photobacterium lutimaris]PSU34246.1 hypothetical protein C9I99_09690 [Photobacterium lutimaris]TDR75833.1 uncharacterized protein DUF3316 [Photobacterium lutimaris]